MIIWWNVIRKGWTTALPEANSCTNISKSTFIVESVLCEDGKSCATKEIGGLPCLCVGNWSISLWEYMITIRWCQATFVLLLAYFEKALLIYLRFYCWNRTSYWIEHKNIYHRIWVVKFWIGIFVLPTLNPCERLQESIVVVRHWNWFTWDYCLCLYSSSWAQKPLHKWMPGHV